MNIEPQRPSIQQLLGLSLIALLATSVGCQSLTTESSASKKKKKDSSWFVFKKKEYQTPQNMNVTWTHDILTLPGKPATRGFGGRFYFYNEKTQAIPVDGELTVYGFDDTHGLPSSEDLSQATKRFKFTAEQFTSHFSEGDLGASYSVWIPWDAAYGEQKKIMLIPTFITKEERMIRGAAASLNLPGRNSEDPNFGVVQQASAIIPTAMPGQLLQTGSRSTTIQVPSRSLQQRNNSPELQAILTELHNQQNPPPSPMYSNPSTLNSAIPNHSAVPNPISLQTPNAEFGTNLNATSQLSQNANPAGIAKANFFQPPTMPATPNFFPGTFTGTNASQPASAINGR